MKNVAQLFIKSLLVVLLLVGATLVVVALSTWKYPFVPEQILAKCAVRLASTHAVLVNLVPGASDFVFNPFKGSPVRVSAVEREQIFETISDCKEDIEVGVADGIDDKSSSLKKLGVLMDLVDDLEDVQYYYNPLGTFYSLHKLSLRPYRKDRTFESVSDARSYLDRLSNLRYRYIDLKEFYATKLEKGVYFPELQVAEAIKQLSTFVSETDGIGSITEVFRSAVGKSGFTKDESDELGKDLDSILRDGIFPEVSHLMAQLEKFNGIKHSRSADSKDYYHAMFRLFTTSDIDPIDAHIHGLKGVAKWKKALVGLSESGGHKTFKDAVASIKSDKDIYYPDTDAGRLAMLRDYSDIVESAKTNLMGRFNAPNGTELLIKPYPKDKQDSPRIARYQRPRLAQPAGIFYVNQGRITDHPKYLMKTLAVHEAIPGHHYQTTVMRDSYDLSLLAQMLPIRSYQEGWAMYAEQLGYEYSPKTPRDSAGYILSNLLRLTRLSVDTGVHAYGWTRQKSIDFYLENTDLNQVAAEREVDRIIALPGQACAYFVGKWTIISLRDLAKKILGPRFSLKDFHEDILSEGPTPLVLLKQKMVEKWESRR